MRQVRFVALSEDGHALVLADEIGHLLALPLDERVNAALAPERGGAPVALAPSEAPPLLAPRDIQARIRAGETADEVARVAGVPVDRVLRYAGPVLQERAMLAQHARRTRMKVGDTVGKITLAEVVDARLGQHGVDLEKISWDAYRRDDGTWRIVATWPSGKATATAVWELDKARQVVTPHDEMAQYLCTDRSAPAHDVVRGREPARPEPGRGGHEPMRAPVVAEPRRE
ncbi:septation protein SepH, partial [Luedemannella flava]|uniref:septation protein SepH n=1 Tax=Luedemannella flava TaxID=349316 RepID=UPI0031D71457